MQVFKQYFPLLFEHLELHTYIFQAENSIGALPGFKPTTLGIRSLGH